MPADKDYTGLSPEQAAEKLVQYGYNRLPESKPPGIAYLFFRQFISPFIYVLLIAAVVSFALGHNLNGIFIFAVLLINAMIGSFQEFSAERAAGALKAMVPHMANVLRDGHTQKINSTHLVPGDLVYLASGDRVPADAICLQTNQLSLDESLLTGESESVLKQAISAETTSKIDDDLTIAESEPDSTRCFAGTNVVRGRALVKIISTGVNTEIGKIALAVSRESTTKPPLLQRIERFTLTVTYATLIIIGLIFMVSLSQGESLEQVFFLSVALAVSAIPEGLPAAITITLAIGMRRMTKVKVIVKSLLAVESLGSCTHIASDKTGTLTVNEMTIRLIQLADGRSFELSGEGLDIHGEITPTAPEPQRPLTEGETQAIANLCSIGVLSNESELYLKKDQWHAQGDQVDIALLVAFNKLVGSHRKYQKRHTEITRLPYESETAYSASLNRNNGGFILSIKGSAEKLATMCLLSQKQSEDVHKEVSKLAAQGYRVLALASKTLATIPEKLEDELTGLNFSGLVGIIDPLRSDAANAVELCRKASIEVSMITGDHPETARAIASNLGILKSDESVICGNKLSRLQTDDKIQLSRLVNENHVFSRVKPVEKQLIVEELEKSGHFVAVTGDGVNDAPALKSAHVGVAMGKCGTDVARESADLILTDDKFSSIVDGIIQGRVVYANIRKVVFLLISTGAAEILLFILSLLAGLPLPLFPVQLLWLNLVTNGIQHVALAFEPSEGNELEHPPRKPTESIFNRLMIERVVATAITMGSLAFILFAFCLKLGMDEFYARNMTLLLMVLFENVQALNSRSETQSLFKMNFLNNPLLIISVIAAQSVHIGAMYIDKLNQILEVAPVSLNHWLTLLSISLILILANEAYKWWNQARS